MWLERSDEAVELARQVALATTATLGEKILSPLTHVALVLVVAHAAWRRYMLAVSLTSLALLVSLAYHVCQMTGMCFGFSVAELQAADHIPSTLLVLVVGSFFTGLGDELAARLTADEAGPLDDAADGDSRGEVAAIAPAAFHLNFARTALVLEVAAVALAVMYYPRGLEPVWVALVVSLLAIAVYHILFRVEPRGLRRDGRFAMTTALVQPIYFMLGVISLAVGIAFFLLEAQSTLFHSLWHVFAAGAVSALLEAVHGAHTSRARAGVVYITP